MDLVGLVRAGMCKLHVIVNINTSDKMNYGSNRLRVSVSRIESVI